MATSRAFTEVIDVFLRQYSPEEAKRRHIALAKKTLREFMARQPIKPQISIEVDGHHAQSESEVKPFGIIAYNISRISGIAQYALDEARRLSPQRSGRFRRSWFAMVNMAEVDPATIAATSQFIITNDQPYFRKIHTGAPGFKQYAIPHGIVQKVQVLVDKRYKKLVTTRIEFLTLQGGYVLQRHNKRKDRTRGQEMTYPALIVTPIQFV